MPRKPQKNRTVTVSWDNYKFLTDKAIGEDTNIKTLLDEAIEKYWRGEKDKESAPAQKVFACPECGDEFETKKALRGHMLGAHSQGTSKEDEKEWYEEEVKA